jgi:hypothetical protein
MTWRTEISKSLENEMGPEALDLTLRIFALFRGIDDTIGGDKFAILVATRDLLTGYVGNKVYAEHKARLYPSIVNEYARYSDSATRDQSSIPSPEEALLVYTGLNSFKEIAAIIADLTGGNANRVRRYLVNAGG